MGPNNGFTCLPDLSEAAMAHHHSDFAAKEGQNQVAEPRPKHFQTHAEQPEGQTKHP